jgi:hypothetical protein
MLTDRLTVLWYCNFLKTVHLGLIEDASVMNLHHTIGKIPSSG